MAKINGQRGGFLQPVEFGRTDSGPYSEFLWEGTYDEVLANVAAVEAAGGTWRFRDSFSGAKCSLTSRTTNRSATRSGAVTVEEHYWELIPMAAEKDVLECDLPVVNYLEEADIKLMRKMVAAGDSAIAKVDKFTEGALLHGAAILYEVMNAGLRSHRVYTPTLKHSIIVSRAHEVFASALYVDRIIANDALVELEGVPSGFQIPLSYDPFNRVWDETISVKYYYGWLKGPPSLRTAAQGKMSIEQHWEFGLWPRIIFGDRVES